MIDLVLKPMIAGCRTLKDYLSAYVTKYFLMFIQGITLFATESTSAGTEMVVGRPAYHRPGSCGPVGADAYYQDTNLKCTDVAELEELRRRKRNVWNCYIERAIYDEIYTQVVGQQDMGHEFQLRHVLQNMFESCHHMSEFVMHTVDVAMDRELLVPVACTLHYARISVPGARLWDQCFETYERKFIGGAYNMGVTCTREINYANRSRELAKKTQSYASGASVPWSMKGGGGHVAERLAMHTMQTFADPWMPDDSGTHLVATPFKLRTRKMVRSPLTAAGQRACRADALRMRAPRHPLTAARQ
jgi:hypothetical protein